MILWPSIQVVTHFPQATQSIANKLVSSKQNKEKRRRKRKLVAILWKEIYYLDSFYKLSAYGGFDLWNSGEGALTAFPLQAD